MSQKSFLQDLDQALVTSLRAVGLADSGQYTPPGGGAAIGCDVVVDQSAAIFGDDLAEVVGRRTLVTLFLRQVPAPARGGVVEADGVSYRLDQLESRDQSRERWVVTYG